MPATEIEAYEDDTRLHFDVKSDFPRSLDSVLQRTDQISQTIVDEEIVEQPWSSPAPMFSHSSRVSHDSTW